VVGRRRGGCKRHIDKTTHNWRLVDRLALVEVVADIQQYSPSQGPVAGNNRNMPWDLNLSKEQFELVWESYEQKMISKGLSN
jgi:hypothetical protein